MHMGTHVCPCSNINIYIYRHMCVSIYLYSVPQKMYTLTSDCCFKKRMVPLHLTAINPYDK